MIWYNPTEGNDPDIKFLLIYSEDMGQEYDSYMFVGHKLSIHSQIKVIPKVLNPKYFIIINNLLKNKTVFTHI